MSSTGAVDAVVTGAGGFIGGHLTRRLLAEGLRVRAVDRKPLDAWYQAHAEAENLVRDVALLDGCTDAMAGAAGAEVFHLAADMGGMGFIESHKADCMLSVLSSTHMLMAARDAGAGRYFYSSSACVYAAGKQTEADVTALREEDAYPATPEDGYGWEKLFSERMARHFREDFGLATRTGRYHNVYGPYGTWTGGREKAPAAACRKVALAVLTGTDEVEIWGDGEQTRSFTYIDDCVEGTLRLARSQVVEPLNIGSDRLVSINQLFAIVESVAGVRLKHRHIPGPLGVRGRNSDNRRIVKELGWEPETLLTAGLERTYRWVYDQVSAQLDGRPHFTS
ncbi:NAD-dependent epimerase/dehydratase family protein [Streptomyces sp. NBC_00237]|uniref:NAD-dependent epimerase/dehydratase family protein n=1 Tax=Streptomyces sp. NBC_00237 TaxID=2975687 RepID=UPI002252F757|nr:NAD-dependent epimerase/dehydratase family protein [Streptomyces sp. NBC_00237]MCX5200251.1 NAD-dependent epimerase/dehydratase family protein [Streptomyces sp. NBC_00237]